MSERLDLIIDATRTKTDSRDTGGWLEKCERLVADCHPRQRAFVLDPGKRVAALVARGGGKTTGGRARFLRRMLTTPRARCVYIATTRQQAEDLMWAPLKDTVEKLEIAARFNETKLSCTFLRNGATLRLCGMDDKAQLEKLRGQPFHEVGIDEAASYPPQLLEHLIFRIIAPRLGDLDGMIWLIGTPGHLLTGPFYDATRVGSDIARAWEERELYPGWLGWSTHSWNLEDGAAYVPAMARLWAEALVEKQRQRYSDQNPVWKREYLGQWAADDTESVYKYRPHDEEGEQWNQWDPERTAQGYAVLPEGEWRYVVGMDMGHSDPFALQVFAYSMTERVLYHVFEFNRRGMYAQTIAQLLLGPELNHEKPGGVFGTIGWPDGAVADTAGLGDAMLDELSHVYGIRIEPAEKKNKNDSIELFNGDLVDGRIKILKGSELEKQLMSLQWASDEFGRVKEHKGQRNDCTDAAIYARRKAAHRFAEEAPAPLPAKGSTAALQRQMQQEEDAAAGLQDDGWGNYLGDDNFDRFFAR